MSAKPHFRLLGVPVRIEPLFWLIAVFLGFRLEDPALIAMWVGVVLVSILVHEFGHALALKAVGQSSAILLHGFGGLTISQARLRRGQSIFVSLAGPFSALVFLGVPAVWLERTYGADLWRDWVLGGGGFGLYPLLQFGVWVNIWWSLANLLPIRPLDGGNVMTEIIGIDRARVLSVIFGAGAAVYAWRYFDLQFAAVFAAFLAFINLAEYRRSRRGDLAPSAFDVEAPAPRGGGGVLPGHHGGPDRHRPGAVGPRRSTSPSRAPMRSRREPPGASRGDADVVPLASAMDANAIEAMAWTMLRRGDATGAHRLLQRSPGGHSPFLAPTVNVAAGGGIDDLADAYLANPSGPANLVPAGVVARSGQVVALLRELLADGPAGRDAAASLQTHLHYGEHFVQAAEAGETIYAAGGPARAQVAFDVAASWSKAGEVDRALEWIGRAVDDGFAAGRLLDGDMDLDAVRQHPGWAEVRGRLDR